MQNKEMKTEMVLFAVPAELLLKAGIFEGDPLLMYAEDNKLIIENDDMAEEEPTCSGDCEHCPFNEIDCDGDCLHCPCSGDCDDAEV